MLSSSSTSKRTFRRRILVSLLCLSAGISLVYFWSDICLWRTEANLQQRKNVAAEKWLKRSRWFSRGVDQRTCLLQLRVARRSGDFREVERLLNQASKVGVPRKELERERWLAMAQTNQFEAMQSHWNDLLKDARDDEPEIARAHYTWAMIYHNHELAKWTLELWHQDYPNDPEPLILTGRYHQSMTSWESSERAYRAALDVAPENADCQLSLAKVLQIRLKTDEAIPLFQKYLRQRPNDASAQQGLAESLATRGEVDKAIQTFQEGLKSHPDNLMLLKSCGELMLSSGDAAGAAVLLEKAYKMVPEHANLANSLARAWKASGRAAEAEPLFAFVAESQPKLLEMGAMEKQLRDQPNNLELRMKIAEIVARFVSRRDAIRWYENLLLIAPKYKPAHEELVKLYQSLGEDKLAMRHATGFEQDAKP